MKNLKQKAISVGTGLAIAIATIGGYAAYQNVASKSAQVIRNVRHGIELNITPMNDAQDAPLMPGDEFTFTVKVKNTANYAQDAQLILDRSNTGINPLVVTESITNNEFEFDYDFDGNINQTSYKVTNLQPGDTKTTTVVVKIKDSATEKDIPGVSTKIQLDAKVNAVQTGKVFDNSQGRN